MGVGCATAMLSRGCKIGRHTGPCLKGHRFVATVLGWGCSPYRFWTERCAGLRSSSWQMGKRLGEARLRGRPLRCAVANAAMGAAEVMADTSSEE